MSDTLKIFICETFKEEIAWILPHILDKNGEICLYPHYCTGASSRQNQIRESMIAHLSDGNSGLFFGDRSLERMGILPPGVRHTGPDTCLELVADKEFIHSFLREGAYILLPGWLFSWERFVTELGFDPGSPTGFYSSGLKEIVLFDTGIVRVPDERIRSFEHFSGLMLRVIPVGISHFKAVIQAEISGWKADAAISRCNQEIASALESKARHLAVLSLLSDIARVSEEQEAITRIITTCYALFAPQIVRYLPVYPDGPGTVLSTPPGNDGGEIKTLMLSVIGKEFQFSDDEKSFLVPVLYKQDTVGILEIVEPSQPDRIREYLNLTLSFTRFLGLAIRNARSWHELQVIREALEKANHELSDNNEELLAISHELQTSNQELVRSQQELGESEQFIKGIVNSARVGIAVLDPGFHVIFWNPEMERIFGLKYSEIQKKNLLDEFPLLIANKRDQYLIQALSGEIVLAPDFELHTGSPGETIWISSIFYPVYDPFHNLIGVIINTHDISQRKEYERDLERAYEAIQIAQAKLGILNSITRHDILNRVMVVTAYSEMLQMSLTDEKDLEKIRRMAVAGKDIQHLIEFTREYQELGVKKPVWQEIGTVMERRSIQSLLSDITLSVTGIRAEIFVDPMFEKVMYNLVENSKRHGEHVSEITVSSEIRGDELVIIYTDNGTGVDHQEKELIFKKGHGKNTGMGLFLIREILGLTSITICECGIPGAGVRFEMKVPNGGWRIL